MNDADKASLSGLVINDAPVVVGPRAANDFTWQLKAEANSRGRIFEVAETNSALEKVFASSLQAVRRRLALRATDSHSAVPATVDTDPLALLPGVLEVTHSLRSERGRLDAEKIRELFTLSRADVARIPGIQEETIRQTPDSERLQRALQAFDVEPRREFCPIRIKNEHSCHALRTEGDNAAGRRSGGGSGHVADDRG